MAKFERPTVKLGVRINEVVQRVASLGRAEPDVASLGKQHTVRVERPEVVVAPRRILPRFGSVHGNPAGSLQIEKCPAVVTGYLAGGLVRGQRQPDLELGGNSGG